MLGSHYRGFKVRKLTERPDGAPEIGYEFEVEHQMTPNTIQSGNTVFLHRVVGWEIQVDDGGRERVSVRAPPVSSRIRPCVGWKSCNMGHIHPFFEGDPPVGVLPPVWGFGSEDD